MEIARPRKFLGLAKSVPILAYFNHVRSKYNLPATKNHGMLDHNMSIGWGPWGSGLSSAKSLGPFPQKVQKIQDRKNKFEKTWPRSADDQQQWPKNQGYHLHPRSPAPPSPCWGGPSSASRKASMGREITPGRLGKHWKNIGSLGKPSTCYISSNPLLEDR